mmetsp:Transcript_44260/g.140746  ORF Transcript_44260/g.140746 Transcript_44260/m.140746 type:complete len:228 (-) Transcript_44260:2023-2706(-)
MLTARVGAAHIVGVVKLQLHGGLVEVAVVHAWHQSAATARVGQQVLDPLDNTSRGLVQQRQPQQKGPLGGGPRQLAVQLHDRMGLNGRRAASPAQRKLAARQTVHLDPGLCLRACGPAAVHAVKASCRPSAACIGAGAGAEGDLQVVQGFQRSSHASMRGIRLQIPVVDKAAQRRPGRLPLPEYDAGVPRPLVLQVPFEEQPVLRVLHQVRTPTVALQADGDRIVSP